MPTRPLLSSGESRLRLLAGDDRGLLESLYGFGDNALLVEPLGFANEAFLGWLHGQLWSLPMALTRGDEALGIAFTLGANVQNLNTRVVVLARRPRACRELLALYVRHVFWSFPIHRLYAQCPDEPGLEEYAEAFEAAAFVNEGRLRQHQAIGGEHQDVWLYGLLRAEFDAWCAEHHPGWQLVDGTRPSGRDR